MTSSVTVCSTCRRALASMNQCDVAPDQELERRRVLQARFAGDAQGGLGQLVAHCGVEVRGGRDLDELLVPALDAAVALAEVDDVASLVAEHLHLDVADCVDELLDVQPPVAERGAGLRLAAREGVGDVVARRAPPACPARHRRRSP